MTTEPKPVETSDYEIVGNFPPEFDKIDKYESFSVSAIEDSEIELGQIIDKEGDDVTIKFDDKGNSFILFDEKAL